jgi:hypothetical protein
LIFGIFAALSQLQIAPAIVNGLFYATPLAIAGSIIVSVGGGGIPTMRRYWEQASSSMETERSESQRRPTGRAPPGRGNEGRSQSAGLRNDESGYPVNLIRR